MKIVRFEDGTYGVRRFSFWITRWVYLIINGKDRFANKNLRWRVIFDFNRDTIEPLIKGTVKEAMVGYQRAKHYDRPIDYGKVVQYYDPNDNTDWLPR